MQRLTSVSALLLALLLLAGLLPRLTAIANPPYDWHCWRQYDTAAMARNFHRRGMDFLHPQVDYAGVPGLVSGELPIASYAMAWLYAWLGERDVVARAWSVSMGLVSLLAFWAALRRLVGPAGAFVATWALAWSPLLVYVHRSIQPDATLCAFICVAAWAAIAALAQGGAWRWALAGICIGLAAAIKPTGWALLAGIVLQLLFALPAQPDHRAARPWIAPAALLPVALAIPLAWYAWALHLQTLGATSFGLLEKLRLDTMLEMLGSPGFYSSWLRALVWDGLGPGAALLVVAGAIRAWSAPRSRWLLVGWAAAFLVFGLVFPLWVVSHIYYNVPLVLCALIVTGFGAEALARTERWRVPARVLLVALTVAMPCFWWFHRTTVGWYEGHDPLYRPGTHLQAWIPAGSLVHVLDEGYRAPHLFYAMDRRGFIDSLFPKERPASGLDTIESRRARGATRLVYVIQSWGDNPFNVLGATPFGKSLLERYRLVYVESTLCLFDLTRPGVTGEALRDRLESLEVVIEAESLERETGQELTDPTACGGALVRTLPGPRPAATLAAIPYGDRWRLPAGRYRWNFVLRVVDDTADRPVGRVEVVSNARGPLAARDVGPRNPSPNRMDAEFQVELATECSGDELVSPHVYDYGDGSFAFDRVTVRPAVPAVN